MDPGTGGLWRRMCRGLAPSARVPGTTRIEQLPPECDGDRGGAGADVELAEDIADVLPRRIVANGEGRRDFAIRLPLGQQAEDIKLTTSQPGLSVNP